MQQTIDRSWRRGWSNACRRLRGGTAAVAKDQFLFGENTSEGVLVADCRQKDMPIVYVNTAFESITGYSRSEALGKNCRYLQGEERLQPQIDQMRAAITSRTSTKVTLRNFRKDGTPFWNELRLMPIHGNTGDVTHFVGFIRDVTASQSAGRSPGTAHLDQLTSSLNRDSFVEALGRLTATGPVLVVNVDVVKFKDVNSGFGFDTGDALLVQIAQRITMMGAEIAARLEGDRFAIAFLDGSGVDLHDRLSHILKVLEERYTLPGASIQPQFATGYAIGAAGADPITLVRNAAAALDRSKATRLRESHGFDGQSAPSARDRLRLTSELQEAATNGDFLYYFQPQVMLETRRIIGAEALLRWSHLTLGLQEPARFVSHLESTGLMLEVGRRGIRSVAEFARRMNASKAQPIKFAMNVSEGEFSRRDFLAHLEGILSASGADPSWLKLELSERMMTDVSDGMLKAFHRLRDLGVGLVIDNFGTGYSSLRLLESFPITEVKIDRSFVQDLAGSATKRIVVESLVKLSRELQFDLVAQGVETEAERKMLIDLGCLLGQGFLFSPPLGVDKFIQMATGVTRRSQGDAIHLATV